MMTNDNKLFLGFSVLGPPVVGQISVWFAETVGITGHNCLLGARRLNSSALAHQADQGFEMFLAQVEDPLLFGCSPGKAVQWDISWENPLSMGIMRRYGDMPSGASSSIAKFVPISPISRGIMVDISN